MGKENFDFEKYLKWCEEKRLEASESSTLDKYKAELKKVAQTGEKAEKIAKQKEVFDVIAKYLGKKVKYDEKYFEGVEKALLGIVFSMAMCSMLNNVDKSVDKILNDFDLNDKGEDNND